MVILCGASICLVLYIFFSRGGKVSVKIDKDGVFLEIHLQLPKKPSTGDSHFS